MLIMLEGYVPTMSGGLLPCGSQALRYGERTAIGNDGGSKGEAVQVGTLWASTTLKTLASATTGAKTGIITAIWARRRPHCQMGAKDVITVEEGGPPS